MKLFRNILFLLLLTSSIGYAQNNLIKIGTFNRFDLLFDGVDEYLNIDNTLTTLASTTKGTWSFWTKPVDATPSSVNHLITFGGINTGNIIELKIFTSGKVNAFLNAAGVTKFALDTDNVVFSDNTWSHVTLVQDGVELVIYIDIVKVPQTFTTTTDKGAWFNDPVLLLGTIGARRTLVGHALLFNGNIDEVSFWDIDLTLTEIQEIYNNGKPTNLKGHSKVANLVGWYQMGEFSSFTGGVWNIVDGSTNSNTAVSVNMELGDRILTTLTYEQPLGLLKIGNNLIVNP